MSQSVNPRVAGRRHQALLDPLDGPQTVLSVSLRIPHSVAEQVLFIPFVGHQCSPERSHPCRAHQLPWTSACPFEQSSLIPESICSLLSTWQPQTPSIHPEEQWIILFSATFWAASSPSLLAWRRSGTQRRPAFAPASPYWYTCNDHLT